MCVCACVYTEKEKESILEFTIMMMTVATTEMTICSQQSPPIGHSIY